jgi:DNA-binding PucR family transcriptional regulator
VRAPVPLSDELAGAVEASGVALLGLTRGASWTQLAALLRSLLAEGDVGDAGPETLGGMPSGDLFALANAIAALLDAPVTIEDRSSRVLAFSGRQDEADESRVETILGRQVPERYSRLLTERGVFRDLYRNDRPVYVEPGLDGFSVPRVAVAVRAGDEVLGSIWAAVREPLSKDRSQALYDAAKLVALHMLRIRAGADVQRRLRTDLVSTALHGGVDAREALNRLGLADQPVIVLALAMPDSPDAERSISADASLATERQRLSDGLAMHLSAVHPRCAAALIGDVTYGLVPVPRNGDGEQSAVRIASDFLDRVGDRVRAVIAIGSVAHSAVGLADARASADRALRVLRASNGTGHRVGRLADVQVEALVFELRDLVAARGDRPTGPVARLFAYDERHNTNLVETLRAWLDAFGDVAAASAAVYVHPNTFRYRLRRLAKVGGIDLADPEARFAAMLQLRVVSPAPPSRNVTGIG